MNLQQQLRAAAQNDDTSKFTVLIHDGRADATANLVGYNGDGSTLLHVAGANSSTAICEQLINKYGADMHVKDEEFGATPLYLAVKHGHIETCKLLIDTGADVNTTDGFDSTALHTAAAYGYTALCELLIREGADVNAIDAFDLTPLDISIRVGHDAVSKILIKNGAVRG